MSEHDVLQNATTMHEGSSSFIRTITVGFGFSPNLLTFLSKALAGSFT
jgi:hypothetical protein